MLFPKPSDNCQTEKETGTVSQFIAMAVDSSPGRGETVFLSPKLSSPVWTDASRSSLKAFLSAWVDDMLMLTGTLMDPCEPCQCLGLNVWWIYSVWNLCSHAWQSILHLECQPTRPVCTPGILINIFFSFDSNIVLTISPIVTPIAAPRQHIHSTCTGGNEWIVCYPPADATIAPCLLFAKSLIIQITARKSFV